MRNGGGFAAPLARELLLRGCVGATPVMCRVRRVLLLREGGGLVVLVVLLLGVMLLLVLVSALWSEAPRNDVT